MAKYTKRKIKVTAAELQKQFFGDNRRPLPGHEDDFPRWIWPYIRRAILAGKLTEEWKVPKGADIKDYPLAVVGFIRKANWCGRDCLRNRLPTCFQRLCTVRSKASAKIR